MGRSNTKDSEWVTLRFRRVLKMDLISLRLPLKGESFPISYEIDRQHFGRVDFTFGKQHFAVVAAG